MRRLLPVMLTLVLLATACGDDTEAADRNPSTTTHATTTPSTTRPSTVPLNPGGPLPEIAGGGSSFGECGGLCVGELRISNADVSLERRSWDRSLRVLAEGTLTADGRARLDDVREGLVGTSFEEVYGCPDCADGGAAWVDLVPVEGAVRVTYEFGGPPEELAEWEAFRRDLSGALAVCASDDIVVVADGCVTEPGEPVERAQRVVRGGFSFGMCLGYCFSELEIDGTDVVLFRSAWADISDDVFADQQFRGELTANARARLDDLEVELTVQSLQETYGCPDCADGGSGWVVVDDGAAEHRSTFEFADPPDALADIDGLVRGWIDTLLACGTDDDVVSAADCDPVVND